MNQETCKDCNCIRSTLTPCACGKYASILPASESETPPAVAVQRSVGLPTAALLIMAAMCCVNAGMRDDSGAWKLVDAIIAYAAIWLALTVTRKQPNDQAEL